MNTNEIVKQVSNKTGMQERAVRRIVTQLFADIGAEVAAGGTVLLTGFAKFEPVDRPARTGRNPHNGQPVEIAAKRTVKIRPMANLKQTVAG